MKTRNKMIDPMTLKRNYLSKHPIDFDYRSISLSIFGSALLVRVAHFFMCKNMIIIFKNAFYMLYKHYKLNIKSLDTLSITTIFYNLLQNYAFTTFLLHFICFSTIYIYLYY